MPRQCGHERCERKRVFGSPIKNDGQDADQIRAGTRGEHLESSLSMRTSIDTACAPGYFGERCRVDGLLDPGAEPLTNSFNFETILE